VPFASKDFLRRLVGELRTPTVPRFRQWELPVYTHNATARPICAKVGLKRIIPSKDVPFGGVFPNVPQSFLIPQLRPELHNYTSNILLTINK